MKTYRYLTLLLFLSIFIQGHTKEKDYNAILTAYCSCQSCCSWHYGKDGKPKFNLRPNVTKVVGQTASGAIAREGLTLAMPKEYPFGTHVYVGGNLLGVCEDRGGAIVAKEGRIKIDVYMDSHQKAIEFGIRKVTVDLIQLPDMDTKHIINTIK